MGFLSQLSSWLGMKKREVQVLVLGLDNSGKSTILNQLKPPEAQTTEVVPTVGFNVEKFTTKTLTFSAFDMSGQGRYRNLWENYYREAHGLIFVVDSTDRLRMAVARDELWQLLDHKEVAARKMPLLLFANKMDEKGALSAVEVTQSLGIDLIRGRSWHIVASCAVTGEGLVEGTDWLSGKIKEYLESLRK
uniref:ADP-ribosylation factor-like protein 6 n=1 Tax=Plectus sambesii TaxID=2011161 RepID=A0A914WEG3_9BILA